MQIVGQSLFLAMIPDTLYRVAQMFWAGYDGCANKVELDAHEHGARRPARRCCNCSGIDADLPVIPIRCTVELTVGLEVHHDKSCLVRIREIDNAFDQST
jgi:hypothetical protein